MANYLDANPEHKPTLDHHRADPAGLVPIVRNGELVCMVSRRSMDQHVPPAPVSTEDYVVGLEVLGFRFAISRDGDDRVMHETTPVLGYTSDSWMQLAAAIKEAFGTDRLRDVAEFVLARDGEAS